MQSDHINSLDKINNLFTSLKSWFPRIVISSTVAILSQVIISPAVQAEPNCKCDSQWCYLRSRSGWQPVSQGSMSRGFRLACIDAWKKYNGATGQPGLSRSCFNKFMSCMDGCDTLHYSQVPYCITRCKSIKNFCKSSTPFHLFMVAELKQNCVF